MTKSTKDIAIQAELDPAGWRPEVHTRLREFLRKDSKPGTPVVFDFDNTCIAGDVGELFGHFLVETMRYRYDLEAFWEQIHRADGRHRLREITEEALSLTAAEREESPIYQRYLAHMAALYGRRLRRAGKRDCYAWAVRLHLGLTPQQMHAWSREAIARELRESRRLERYGTDEDEVVEVSRGIRPLLEMRQLMFTLDQSGFEVWIVSATNVWTVRQFAPYFGVPAERVLGNRVEVRNGELTAETIRPALFREGKVEIIEKVIGRTPALVAGDAVTDFEMLGMATEISLVIDRGDKMLRREAKSQGWLLQPQQELTQESPDPGDLECLEEKR